MSLGSPLHEVWGPHRQLNIWQGTTAFVGRFNPCRDHFVYPSNERWCYIVTSSLIGWAHKQNALVMLSLFLETWKYVCIWYNFSIMRWHRHLKTWWSKEPRHQLQLYLPWYPRMFCFQQLKSLRPYQIGWHFADNIFKCILSMEIFGILWLFTFWHWFKWWLATIKLPADNGGPSAGKINMV